MHRLLIAIAALGLAGCATIEQRWDEWRGKKPDPEQLSNDHNNFPPGMIWLGHDISSWPQTATISDVRVSGATISFPYDKANSWPAHPTVKARDGGDINGNVWIVAQIDGTWYATTWEWLRVGQQSKPVSSIYGPGHLHPREFSGWRPVSGERYGFMVSGFARDANRTVQERSQVKWITWP